MSLLTVSCNRPAGVKAVAYSDISYEEIEEATRLALRNESIDVSIYSNYILKILIYCKENRKKHQHFWKTRS